MPVKSVIHLALLVTFLFSTIYLFWPATPLLAAYSLSAEHSRVLLTPADMATIVQRMNSPSPQEPYATWFQRIKQREESAQSNAGMTPNLMSLALVYHGLQDSTEKQTYANRYIDAFVDTSGVGIRWTGNKFADSSQNAELYGWCYNNVIVNSDAVSNNTVKVVI